MDAVETPTSAPESSTTQRPPATRPTTTTTAERALSYEFEVPSRVNPDLPYGPAASIDNVITFVRYRGIHPPDDQLIVDAMVATCEYFDTASPDKSRDFGALTTDIAMYETIGPADYLHSTAQVLSDLLTHYDPDRPQDERWGAVLVLASGASLVICPEHEQKVPTVG